MRFGNLRKPEALAEPGHCCRKLEQPDTAIDTGARLVCMATTPENVVSAFRESGIVSFPDQRNLALMVRDRRAASAGLTKMKVVSEE